MALRSNQPSPRVRTALAARQSAASSRTTSQVRQPLPAIVADEKSDLVTSAFVRRILCPSHLQHESEKNELQGTAVADLLPPLTSSNEIDLQLYAFIALIIKECVQSWYTRFSPDQIFVDEIVHIIAHCTRGLEERARKTDLEVLILDDIPALLDAHLYAHRTALAASLSGDTVRAEYIYHVLRPHPALDHNFDAHDRADDDGSNGKFLAYRHLLAQGLLAVLLPPGDLQNPCLRALVSEVSADLVIGNFIGARFCEGLFIYDSIRKAADIVQPRIGHSPWAVDLQEHPKDRLSRFGLLSRTAFAGAKTHRQQLSDWAMLLVHYFMLVITAIRWTISAIASSPTLPARAGATTRAKSTNDHNASFSPSSAAKFTSEPSSAGRIKTMKPVVQYRFWNLLMHLVRLELRMPWAVGMFSLLNTIATRITNIFSEPETSFDR